MSADVHGSWKSGRTWVYIHRFFLECKPAHAFALGPRTAHIDQMTQITGPSRTDAAI